MTTLEYIYDGEYLYPGLLEKIKSIENTTNINNNDHFPFFIIKKK